MSEKNLSDKAKEALRHIRNGIMHFGAAPSVRELMELLGYKSPHSASLILGELKANGFIKRNKKKEIQLIKDLISENMVRTVSVPLVGAVSCGPLLLAEENIEAMVPVSVTLARPGSKYFLLRASGDSMNKAGINNNDLILVRQQSDAEPGQKIVTLVDDDATVKKYYKKDNVVVLKPESTNPKHQPIVLTDTFHIQGVVVATLPNIEK